MQEMIQDWAPELSARLGRPIAEIAREGLSASDFSVSRSVEIREPPGRVVRFSLAFALIRPAHSVAAVFTEHYGYLEFDLEEDSVVAEIHETLYVHQGDA
ncbi:hypothetical protein [Luteimonas aquatica]|uniref:hypothetical protein n=1 Tax=Luteimonas aquatica TaxID=450364 RepID=UPI001F5A970B|nr:hypothetical protein [Luteimonas aquatica]